MLIKQDFTVEKVLNEFPWVASIFIKFKIEPKDKKTIAQLCKESNVDISNFLIELNMAVERPDREGIDDKLIPERENLLSTVPNRIEAENKVSEMANIFPEIIPILKEYFGESNFMCKSFQIDFKTICDERNVCLEDLLNECNQKIRITREPILTEDTIVSDIIRAYPYLAEIFDELQINLKEIEDSTIEEVAKKNKIDLENLIKKLNSKLKFKTKI